MLSIFIFHANILLTLVNNLSKTRNKLLCHPTAKFLVIIKPLLHIPPTVQKHLQADENETSAELIPTYPLSIPDVCDCP